MVSREWRRENNKETITNKEWQKREWCEDSMAKTE
jgi:hypothetical protein